MTQKEIDAGLVYLPVTLTEGVMIAAAALLAMSVAFYLTRQRAEVETAVQ